MRTDVLEQFWDQAMRNPGRELRARVLVASEAIARGGAGAADARVESAAAAVQLIHLASLAHDDLIDGSDLRRGQPSLPARFGASVCGAGGVLLLGRALSLFARCGEEALTLASAAARRVCDGQMAELEARYDPRRTELQYMEAVELKTGSMFRLPALLGACFGGAEPAVREALARCGAALGVAHQLIDDLLDLTGTTELTGKPVGGDLRNGNYTLPVILAMRERPAIARLIGADGTLAAVIDQVHQTGAIARARERAGELIGAAEQAIASLPEAHLLAAILAEDARALAAVAP